MLLLLLSVPPVSLHLLVSSDAGEPGPRGPLLLLYDYQESHLTGTPLLQLLQRLLRLLHAMLLQHHSGDCRRRDTQGSPLGPLPRHMAGGGLSPARPLGRSPADGCLQERALRAVPLAVAGALGNPPPALPSAAAAESLTFQLLLCLQQPNQEARCISVVVAAAAASGLGPPVPP